MGRESSLVKTCRKILADRGGFSVKLNPTNGAGLTDLAVSYRGVSLWAEAKAGRNEGTRPGRKKLQEHVRAEIRKSGGRTAVWREPDDCRRTLDEIDAEIDLRLDP